MLLHLPIDVLQHICWSVAQRKFNYETFSFDGDLGQNMFFKLTQIDSPCGNTLAYQAMRSSCKQLKCMSDDVRPSICFKGGDNVEPYLKRMPNLHTVTIEELTSTASCHGTLVSLHNILRRISTLKLRDIQTLSLGRTDQIGNGLLLFSNTLQHLFLTNVEFDQRDVAASIGSNSINSTCSSLRCITQLKVLKTLELSHVSPGIVTEDIAGCTGLIRLKLLHNKQAGEALDVSSLTCLTELCVTNYAAKALCVHGLTALEFLDCHSNSITKLNVSTCTSLRNLTCNSNLMNQLDVTAIPSLTHLVCNENPISTLRLPSRCLLKKLDCINTNIADLFNASSCEELISLNCSGSKVSNLDLRGCLALQQLFASNNSNLLTINLSGLKYFSHVELDDTEALRTLNLTDCSMLSGLHVGYSKVQDVNVAGCTALHILSFCGCDSLETVDVSQCASLEELDCQCTLLKAIQLLDCPTLHRLDVSRSPLELLDLSLCVELQTVSCRKAKITEINVVSSASTLTSLDCADCEYLEVLCAASCRKLEYLTCSGCPQLRELNISGCNSLHNLTR